MGLNLILALVLALSLFLNAALAQNLDQDAISERPAYVFRGWHKMSGGGSKVNNLLNSEHGSTPHAFLQGQEPTHLLKHDDVKALIEGHVFQENVSTPCSSWATDLQTALSWAGQDDESQVAIVDTSVLQPHNMVYHVPTLEKHGLVGAAGLGDDEYLIYAPVRSPAYHSVSVRQLIDLGLSPHGKDEPVTDKLVSSVLKVAELFQSPSAKAEGNPNAILSFLASEMARRVQKVNVRSKFRAEVIKESWTAQELATIIKGCSHLLDLVPSGSHLVNPHMFTTGLPQVYLAKELLLAFEDAVRGRAQ